MAPYGRWVAWPSAAGGLWPCVSKPSIARQQGGPGENNVKIVADQNIPFVAECLASVGQVTVLPGRRITRDALADAEALLVRSITPVNAALLDGTPVRFVATATIGTDHVDTAYLASRGIGFASAPGSNADSVAEWLIAALLAMGKKHRLTLAGRRIGIIGVGNVGRRVEARCRALGMEPILNDPPLERQTGDAKYRPLAEALACDFVTLHVPLTREGPDATYHLADARFFDAIKPGAFFINSARGAVHDTAALKHARATGRIAGYVLDVWENEPRVDPDLLRKAELSTPHVAGYAFDGKVRGMIMIYRALCEHFGIEPRHEESDFLPPPDVPEIRIDAPPADEQAAIHDIVQQVYAVNRDDFNMREILLLEEDRRGPWFDDLRKNYPFRREFHNTRIVVPAACDTLAAKLAGIGFTVVRDTP